jgi:uncharacterized protein (TIGR02996 family)
VLWDAYVNEPDLGLCDRHKYLRSRHHSISPPIEQSLMRIGAAAWEPRADRSRSLAVAVFTHDYNDSFLHAAVRAICQTRPVTPWALCALEHFLTFREDIFEGAGPYFREARQILAAFAAGERGEGVGPGGTPEEDAFLLAIWNAPGDHLPRLIYADWLDEHGRAEQAEFIRLQCAPPCAPASAEETALRERYDDVQRKIYRTDRAWDWMWDHLGRRTPAAEPPP